MTKKEKIDSEGPLENKEQEDFSNALKKIVEEAETMSGRIDKLHRSDNKYEDSVKTLIEREEKIKDKLKNAGVEGKDLADLTDTFSINNLEKMEAEKEKWIDSLTGLRNKRAYNEEAPQLLNIERRQKNDCSLLVIDFDHFKKVNDEYGHNAGDVVLKKMAEILKENVRSSDIVYRFGGEEFVIFLPATISSRAADIAEKIRAKIEMTDIVVNDTKGDEVVLKKTISIGCIGTDQLKEWDKIDDVDGYKNDSFSKFLTSMFDGADLSVNNSKDKGRNCVTVYNEDLLSKEQS